MISVFVLFESNDRIFVHRLRLIFSATRSCIVLPTVPAPTARE